MAKEIEAKFLNIDRDGIVAKLESLGGVKVAEQTMYKRQVLNLPKATSYDDVGSAWVRVRDEGNRIALTYKKILDNSVSGVEEVEVEVSDFDITVSLLEKIGCNKDVYEQNYREAWELDGAEVTIDEWPHIPAFVEIEAKDENTVKGVAERMGFDWDKAVFGSVGNVYKQHFNIGSIHEITKTGKLQFDIPLPEEIEKLRK